MTTKWIFVVFFVVLVVVQSANADFLVIDIGRIQVSEIFQPLRNDMMGWLSAAGGARVDAAERVSIAVQDYCLIAPDKCAALGIVVKPH